jgi:hypothetical protein
MARSPSKSLDYDLKRERAFKHLHDLDIEVQGWINGDHHSVRPEGDPQRGTRWLVTAEQPPRDPFSLLIGDALHNLRSCLDLLAYALASAYTRPLPVDIADTSEFPIFGDEDRAGNSGVGFNFFHNVKRKTGDPAPGSGLYKIRGWNPAARTEVERLQPYHRGTKFRADPLWVLHELDRISKHRLLHGTVAALEGTFWNPTESVNVAALSSGVIESMTGIVDTDTPFAAFPPFIPTDPSKDMHVEITPALDIAFAKGTPCVAEESILKTLYGLYVHVAGTIIPAFTRFL